MTHDVTHDMLNGNPSLKEERFTEKIGCIEIKDNVFVGVGTTILYNVQIGSNVIIGAGSLVNKDIPDNSVVGGVPAKVISTFDEYIAKRKSEPPLPLELAPSREQISNAAALWCWKIFNDSHHELR